MGPLSLQWGVPGAAFLVARTSPCAQTFAPGSLPALLRNLPLKFRQCLWGVIGGLDWECVELWTFHQVCEAMSFPWEEPTPLPTAGEETLDWNLGFLGLDAGLSPGATE